MIREIFDIFTDSLNSFQGQEENERVILLLRRHPFTTMVKIGFLLTISLIPIITLLVFWSYIVSDGWLDLFLLVSSVWYLGFLLIIFHTLTIYTLSTVLITDQRIIDSDQHGLFDRKIAELHNHRIQDVSTHTTGILETLLGYGDVTVQTAASEKQFTFHKMPKPNKVKDSIMQVTDIDSRGDVENQDSEGLS